MRACSSGMNSPLRKTVSLISASLSLRLFEQEPQAIPAAAEDACDRNVFQGYHRVLAVRFAFELDAHDADFLTRRNRREQRLLSFHARLQLLPETLWNTQI